MHWLIKCRSKPDTDALREATIDAHRNFLDGYAQATWYSGPVFTDDNRNAIGSLRLIEFPGREAAAAYIDADPYTRAGLFEAISIERWRPLLDVRQRDYRRKEGTMQFVVHCRDKPGASARRAALHQAHLDYLGDHDDIVVACGPLLDDDGVDTVGGVLILDVADKAQAEAFRAAEPFNRAGVYDSTLERWRFGHV